MSRLKDVLQELKRRFVDKKGKEERPAPSFPKQATTSPSEKAHKDSPKHVPQRDSYFVQIGFDFGTCYSKCICRDVMTNKAWIYIPDQSDGLELPFLIPGSLQFQGGRLGHLNHSDLEYQPNGLYHLKHALEKVALRHWADPALDPFRVQADEHSDADRLGAFVHACAVYFLAGVLGEIKEQVRQKFPGKHANDYIAVNLAVPVANAERRDVNSLYRTILYQAWALADQIKGHPNIEIAELERLISNIGGKWVQRSDACCIYPETSANVQGFVRSRTSSEGTYLFSDTGAGTVDQSVFILSRQSGHEHLAYLHSAVFPLGSSRIERQAAATTGEVGWKALEKWRIRKENGESDGVLYQARSWIHENLNRATHGTLAKAKSKLYRSEQLEESKVIFGGGGHCDYPYERAVLHPFSGGLFRGAIFPDTLGMPIPKDLELNANRSHWMRRLSVAYGLSFEKDELSTFTYPSQLATPRPEELWRQNRHIPDAPTKDEC